MLEVGRRVTHKAGRAAIYLGPGPDINYSTTSKVYELDSGQQAVWHNKDLNEDVTSPQALSVVVLNATHVRISTVFWGVVLAHLAIGIVGGLIFIIMR